MHGLGVDLGSSGVKAVALARDGDGISLLGAGREELAPGAVHDGAARDPEAVGSALRRLLARMGVRCRLAGLALGGSSVLIKRFAAPSEPVASARTAEAFREAVAREAARHVPFHLESVEFDFEGPLPREAESGVGEESGAATVVFGAAPRETIRDHCRAMAAAGREVTRIELEPYALYAAARLDVSGASSPSERGPLAIVEVGASRACVHVFGDAPARGAAPSAAGQGPGDLLASIPVPGTGALAADSPAPPQAPFPFPPEAAERPGGPPGPGWPATGGNEAGVFANRIAATLREALREAEVRQPLRILLSGGGAGVPEIRARLAALDLGTPVALDPLRRLGFGGQGTAFAVAAGLAYQQLLDRPGTRGRRRS